MLFKPGDLVRDAGGRILRFITLMGDSTMAICRLVRDKSVAYVRVATLALVCWGIMVENAHGKPPDDDASITIIQRPHQGFMTPTSGKQLT
jgi:hypothetical protein